MMGLFHRKKEQNNTIECACSGTVDQDNVNNENVCCCSGNTESTESCCSEAENGVCCIKVLGSGCKSCHQLYENAKDATKNMNLNIEVEYVTDMESIVSYGVMSMPALVVNEKVVAMGKVLKSNDIETLLQKFIR